MGSNHRTPGNDSVIGALDPEPSAVSARTMRAGEAIRVQVSLKPHEAQAIVKQLRDGKINHIGLTSNRTVDGRQYTTLARLLDMSQQNKYCLGLAVLFHSYDDFSFSVSCFKIPDCFSRFT